MEKVRVISVKLERERERESERVGEMLISII